jgi:hypothetical protein
MATWGYLRVSTNHQKTENQRLAILEYANKNKATIDNWIEVKASTRKAAKVRRLDELSDLRKGDAVLHMIFNFSDDNIYDVLLNLGAAATKRVLRLWKETGDYFFFVMKDSGLTAFHQKIDTPWYEYDYFGVMERSKSSESQYDSAVQSFKRHNMGHGTYLYMNYQDNRFEARPTR